MPACFYLGDEYDLAAQAVQNKPVMYDARDLTTHGVVVGMTGSGKTGLCISILEEAAIDGIPCIIIDPKGDLTNLLLQFPDLAPDDFKKWLNPEVHPPKYEQIVTDFMAKSGVYIPDVLGNLKASSLISQALDPVWTGKKTAQEALGEVVPKANKVLEEEEKAP